MGIRAKLNSDRRYTLGDLIDEAKRAGFRPNKALVSRFVTVGLLDRADGTGPGYKGGVRWTWPQSQRDLLLTLLDKHRTVRSPLSLANIPIAVWLLWGEGWVPLRQARRALETFAEVQKEAPRHDYRRAALKLVGELAQPRADFRAKDALVDTLVHSAQTRQFDAATIGPLLNAVVGGSEPTAQTDGPRTLGILEAQWAARSRFHELTDGYFQWARMFALVGQASYARDWRHLASDPRFGQLNEPFDFEHVANSACRDVLFVLGMALVLPRSRELPEALRLGPWLDGRGHVETDIEVHRTPLWLPTGHEAGSLGINVRIWIDPVTTEPT